MLFFFSDYYYFFLYSFLLSFKVFMGRMALVVGALNAAEVEVISMGRLAIVPVLNVVEEMLGGIKPGSAGNETANESSKNGKTEGNCKCSKLVASLLSWGSDSFSSWRVEVFIISVSEVVLC